MSCLPLWQRLLRRWFPAGYHRAKHGPFYPRYTLERGVA